MKIAYFDCFSGISGDMILGALIDSGLDAKKLGKELKKLKIGNVRIIAKKVMKKGVLATRFRIIEGRKHPHNERNLKEINKIIGISSLDREIKKRAKNIFRRIAMAESKIHSVPIDKIHFHELGAIDTIVDVAGALIGMKMLGIGRVYCSRLNVGTGFVEFSHGRFPVPAPATAEMLKNVPIYNDGTQAELVTPTGAAIITEIASGFGSLPKMTVERTGYGGGENNLEHPNVLRVFIGTLGDGEESAGAIHLMETNIDNMNPEWYPYVMERLFENGALDVYTTSIMMKKGRPGIKLTVLSKEDDIERLSGIIFGETTTLGIRILRAERRILEREIRSVKTRYGAIRLKISKQGGKILNAVPEFDDVSRIARKKRIPLKRIYKELSGNLF